jgi:Tfp pilus assembly protein PilW
MRVRHSFGRGKDHESGLTLAELTVAMAITSILLAAIATVTMSTLKAARTVNVKTSTAADARIGLETLSRTLRAANIPPGETAAITLATPTTVTFYSQINRSTALVVGGVVIPTKIEYYQSGNCLWEAQTPARKLSAPSSTGSLFAWDTGRTQKCVLRTTSQSNLFAYYPSAALNSTAIVVPTAGLTTAGIATVQSIQITMTVVDPGNATVSGTPIITRVTLDNIVLAAGGTT